MFQNEQIITQNQGVLDTNNAIVNAISNKIKTENELIDSVKDLAWQVSQLKEQMSIANDEVESGSMIDELKEELEKISKSITDGFQILLNEIRR